MPDGLEGGLRHDRILITGTDTNVGKTWVTCALARALRESGHHVVAIKPVESGRPGDPGDEEDGVLLARATRQTAPRHALVRLAEPLAPMLAQGGELDFDDLVLACERYADGAQLTLYEGTGGLLSPITWEWNAVDLARSLGCRMLIVGTDRLGAINHTLLTLSAIEFAGLETAGVVLTAPETADRSTGSNADAISRLAGIDRVVVAPRTLDPTAASHALAPVVRWITPGTSPATH